MTENVIQAYYVQGDFLEQRPLKIPQSDEPSPIWVDVSLCSEREDILFNGLEKLLGNEGILHGELSSLLRKHKDFHFEEGKDFILIHFLFANGASHRYCDPWTIILTQKTLFTFHPEHTSISLDALKSWNEIEAPFDVMLGLLSVILENSGEFVGQITGNSDDISSQLFGQRSFPIHGYDISKEIMSAGKLGLFVMRIQQSLQMMHIICETFLDTKRFKEFMKEEKQDLYVDKLTRYAGVVDSQENLAGYVIQNIGYISDVALGMIQIQQNFLMLFLSILATVLVPPSIVVSIFALIGFDNTPKIPWLMGILILFVTILISSHIGYRILKKRCLK